MQITYDTDEEILLERYYGIHGYSKIVDKTQEEVEELHAVMAEQGHLIRENQWAPQEVVTEIADVIICLASIQRHDFLWGQVQEEIKFKLKREKERMDAYTI